MSPTARLLLFLAAALLAITAYAMLPRYEIYSQGSLLVRVDRWKGTAETTPAHDPATEWATYYRMTPAPRDPNTAGRRRFFGQ